MPISILPLAFAPRAAVSSLNLILISLRYCFIRLINFGLYFAISVGVRRCVAENMFRSLEETWNEILQ